MLGGYGFHGVTFGGDGANEKGAWGRDVAVCRILV